MSARASSGSPAPARTRKGVGNDPAPWSDGNGEESDRESGNDQAARGAFASVEYDSDANAENDDAWKAENERPAGPSL